jgi:hypothetical protein
MHIYIGDEDVVNNIAASMLSYSKTSVTYGSAITFSVYKKSTDGTFYFNIALDD